MNITPYPEGGGAGGSRVKIENKNINRKIGFINPPTSHYSFHNVYYYIQQFNIQHMDGTLFTISSKIFAYFVALSSDTNTFFLTPAKIIFLISDEI